MTGGAQMVESVSRFGRKNKIERGFGEIAMVQPLVVGVPEAAVLLNVSEATVWRLIAGRQIESCMVGQSRKIRMKEIERYLDDNSVPIKTAS
jgi:excisionase family DNA binding protein